MMGKANNKSIKERTREWKRGGKLREEMREAKEKTWKRRDKQAKSIRETNLLSIQILPLVHNIFV